MLETHFQCVTELFPFSHNPPYPWEGIMPKNEKEKGKKRKDKRKKEKG
jgi:hypothetical protein